MLFRSPRFLRKPSLASGQTSMALAASMLIKKTRLTSDLWGWVWSWSLGASGVGVGVAEVGASVAGEVLVAAGDCASGEGVEVGAVCCGPLARKMTVNAAAKATASVSIAVLFFWILPGFMEGFV